MIIGISGPSGSGKTTIARTLRQLLASSSPRCRVQILHQDDFYRPEKGIPRTTTRAGSVVNWDCAEALDMDAFVKTLRSYRDNGGQFPDDVREDLAKRAKEDSNDRAATGVSQEVLLTFEDSTALQIDGNILIVDGFMMFHDTHVLDALDLSILLRGSYSKLKKRRERRSGYVTLEGFWTDPEGYFDDVVWPEYCASHGPLFIDEDVEGEIVDGKQVQCSTAIDLDLDASFEFVMSTIERFLQDRDNDSSL